MSLRRSIARPPSACMSCGSELAWYDNVPVASWLWLRGRCRSCGTSISARYPAVELATAALVAACFVKFGFSGEAFLAAFFCVVLVALSAIDLEHRIVPNRIVVPAAVVVAVGVIVVIVVIVRVIVGRVIRGIIPWIKPPPGAVDEDEDATVMRVSASLVPIAMPVCIMSGKRMILHERLSVCCC